MSDMPDFDSMSPEEMMRWMESLAKRQGADEGLTTDADLEIDEVDADDERLAGQGDYIPYGWTEEQWQAQLEKEAQQKAERAAQRQQQEAAPPPEPEPAPEPEPVSEPEPTPAQPAASAEGEMPDFDSMSPEEMMRWMESLAKRQGADEGLTTTADLEIGEISADDERLAGQGEYIPYGWTEEQWQAQLEKEARQKAERAAQRQQQEPDDLFDDEDEEDFMEALSGDVLQAPSLDQLFGSASEDENVLPELEDDFTSQPTEIVESTEAEEQPEQPAAQNPMEWLTGLTGQEDEAPELDFDLDALGNLEGLATSEEADDPMSWLAGLAAGDEQPAADETADEAEEGSLEWMENLARRQGANTQELITGGYGEVPEASEEEQDDPGYQPFSFEEGTGGTFSESEEPAQQQDFSSVGDPQDWLSELANAGDSEADSDELFDIDFSGEENVIGEEADDEEEIPEEYSEVTDDVVEKMNRGEASPEDIANFFDAQFARAATRTDVPDYIEDEEDDLVPPIEAEIPDWLQETMAESTPEDEDEVSATSTAEMMVAGLGLDEDSGAGEEEEFPDWLVEGSEEDTGVITDDIFDEDAAAADLPSGREDTWVQAFASEGSGDIEEWYANAVQQVTGEVAGIDEEFLAAEVEEADLEALVDEGEGLMAADLPAETQLPAGQPQALPAWMTGEEASTAAEMPAIEMDMEEDLSWLEADGADLDEEDLDDEEMPSWLRQQVDDDVVVGEEEAPDWIAEAGLGDIPLEEIPEWLRETMDEEEAIEQEEAEAVFEAPEAASEPAEAPEPEVSTEERSFPVVPQRSPAPVSIAVADIDVAAYLQSARQKVSSGDVNGGVQDFEMVVRANQALDEVEQEVKQLAEKDEKKNPAVHRVLGDVLMRQGKLQEALDTYRKALNML